MAVTTKKKKYVSTTNACKLCTPLGACIAFRGIEGGMPLLHGSQGCSTYMRRYIISHFKEPIDIASSSLGEKQAVYGGGANLKQGLRNVTEKYVPALIGIGTTCLTETIGDNVPMFLSEYKKEFGTPEMPVLVPVSTPSYSGTHIDGFNNAVKATVDVLSEGGIKNRSVNIMPGFVSPQDIRYLKEILDDFELTYSILPDISETLDGPALEEYEKIPSGGTPLKAIKSMGCAQASIEFGRTLHIGKTAGSVLEDRFLVRNHIIGLPLGVNETDRFFELLSYLSGHPVPQKYVLERGRLIDSFVDAHKYIFETRAVVYGEEDFVVGLTAFLTEIGIIPVMCASGGKSNRLAEAIKEAAPFLPEETVIREGVDFMEISDEVQELNPDILVGHSKGYHLSRKMKIPLVRVGFPIHDRIGGQRILHLGYRGAQELFDKIVNAVIEYKQESSPVGYFYM
jgi:nitrogenase molybdenum-iron protein NifN